MQNRYKSIALTLFSLLTLSISAVAQSITIGNGTATTYQLPINNFYRYTLSQQIFTSAEIAAAGGGAGTILSIGFQYSYTTASTVKSSCVIYLCETTKTEFSSTSDWIASTNFTQVYSGPMNCTQGWNTFTFTTPFEYSGTGNLCIMIDDNSNNYNGSSYTFYKHTASGNRTLHYYSDSTNPTITSPGSATSRTTDRSNIQLFFAATEEHTLTYNTTANCTGTASAAPASVTAIGATQVTTTPPTCSNAQYFTGWNTAANGSGTNYAPGASIYLGTDITLYAQFTNTPPDIDVNMHNGSATIICGETYHFYDSGGQNGNYGSNENYTFTYTSNTGSALRIVFNSFSTESSYDKLTIYDSPTASGTTLANQVSGTQTLGPYVATSGSVTFKFTSDGSVTYAGWSATITCDCPTINVNPTVTNVSCLGFADGSISVTATGGDAPYQYSWDGFAETSNTLSNLSIGSYYATATDANGCSGTSIVQLTADTDIVPDFTSVQRMYCLNANIPPLPTTSDNGITGTWNPSTMNNTLSTTYTFTPNPGQCAEQTSIVVNIDPTIPTATITGVPVICGTDGSTTDLSIETNAASYVWSTGSTNQTITVNNIGTYYVTVTGANGCTATTNASVSRAGEINVTATILTPINCFGDEASVRIVASGGMAPYVGNGTFNVPAGNNTFTVSDANGCSKSVDMNISGPAELTANANTTNPICHDQQITSAITAIGGTAPYTILWDDNSTNFFNGNIPTNTTFNYTITDANSCTYTNSLYIVNPPAIITTVSATDVNCYGANTSTATITGTTNGVAPYTYTWDNGMMGNTAQNVTGGSHTITTTDANGCSDISTFNVNQPEAIAIATEVTNAECGGVTGSIGISISNGHAPYTVLWNNGSTVNNQTNIGPGTYTVVVTDNTGCSISKDITVNVTGGLTVDVVVDSPISCQGAPNGRLDATSNGYGYISYNWSDNQYTEIAQNLTAGTYDVTVTDEWGCSGTGSQSLSDPEPFIVTETIKGVTCAQASDASIALNISGGVTPYTVIWNGYIEGITLQNAMAGTYIAQISDAVNCSTTRVYTIEEPDPLYLNIEYDGIKCYGEKNGKISLSAEGGLAPYSFRIVKGANNIMSSNSNHLSAGIYSSIVSDANGCIIEKKIEIEQPDKLDADYYVSNVSCIGKKDGQIELALNGGVSPYTFAWSNRSDTTPSISNLIQGKYTVVITDANNCKTSISDIPVDEELVRCLGIPDVLTPNGDGINDEWTIQNIDMYPNAKLYVFNRWGQLMWQGNYDEHWDGTRKGHILPAGTYTYLIVPDPEKRKEIEEYSGAITLVY